MQTKIRKNRKSKKLPPAVFLDRDGVIIREVDHLNRPEELRLLPGAAAAIRRLNRTGFTVVIISNQAAIAKGLLTEKGLRHIHEIFLRRLGRGGARVEATYYCPHHPESRVRKYAKRCACRKPAPGMLYRAAREKRLDLSRSFLIGDKTVDVLTAKNAGVKSILVTTGYGGRDSLHDVRPDWQVKNLSAAADLIIRELKK